MAGPKYELVFTDRLLVTLVHLRTGLTHEALGVLYDVGSSTAPAVTPARTLVRTSTTEAYATPAGSRRRPPAGGADDVHLCDAQRHWGRHSVEAALRAPPSGQWSAVHDVRPGWFDHVGPTQRCLVLQQGGTADGGIARDQIAETLIRSLQTNTALGKTFELMATEGEEPSDWAELFGALKTDESGSVDGVLDPYDLPVEAEPRAVRADLDAIRSLHGTSG